MVHLRTSSKLVLVIFAVSVSILVIQLSQLSLDNPPLTKIKSRRPFSVSRQEKNVQPNKNSNLGKSKIKDEKADHQDDWQEAFPDFNGKHDLHVDGQIDVKNGEKHPLNDFLANDGRSAGGGDRIVPEDKMVQDSLVFDWPKEEIQSAKTWRNAGLSQDKAKSRAGAKRDQHKDDDTCAFILKEDNLVRNCITGNNIARVEHTRPTKQITIPKNATHEPGHARKISFQKVFDSRAWGHSWDAGYQGLNASGRGATLDWSQEAIATLHSAVNQIKQHTGKSKIKMLDLPCGDMQWMPKFLRTRDDVDYTGIDIVPNLIYNHQEKYRSESWKFRLVDVLKTEDIDKYDLIFCRMLMQHLYFGDVLKLLQIFSQSGSSYLLTTTFVTTAMNDELYMDDNPGRVRALNLQLPPVQLPAPLCLQRDGPGGRIFEGWSHFLALWALPLSQVVACDKIYYISLHHSEYNIYSCSKLKELL